MIRKISGFLTLLSVVTASVADSDGYFCTGPDYLVYQFNGVSVPQPGHILTYIKFDCEGADFNSKKIRLQNFQVHRMRCKDNAVEVLSWTTRFVIDLTKENEMTVISSDPYDRENISEEYTSTNLGLWGESGSRLVGFDDNGNNIRLRIKGGQTTEPIENGTLIKHFRETRLACIDPSGEIIKEQQIFKGISKESVH